MTLTLNKGVFLRSDFARAWQGDDPFGRVNAIEGEVFRAREGRRTLRFELNGRSYFLKHHRGIGWKEIFKNLSQFKEPVLGARQEFNAAQKLTSLGIDTLCIAGFGERGVNPAKRESFIITDDLVDTSSLEDVFETVLPNLSDHVFKRSLISRVAVIAQRMHDAGVNHRDFYLCHFLMSNKDIANKNAEGSISLIDLHRSQVRKNVPMRWLIKDLGGLYFSTAKGKLSKTDIFRFIRTYSGNKPSSEIRNNGVFWGKVRYEAEKIYRRDFGKKPSFPLNYYS